MESLNKNIDASNQELRAVKNEIRQKLEIEKGIDITLQKKDYIRIDREIEQLKQKEEELKYIIEENVRKRKRNTTDKTIAMEYYFLIRMKLKDIELGKEIMKQLDYIQDNSKNAQGINVKFIERETDKLLNATVDFAENYVSSKSVSFLK